MYAIKKKISKGGYESFDTEHYGELLPVNEDKEKFIFWEEHMIEKKETDQERNTLRNINMFVSITCSKKKNFFGKMRKHYNATVKVNIENVTDLLRFDSNTARTMTAVAPVCVSKKGTVKDIEVYYPLVGISLFIRIDHNVHKFYYKNKYNAKATALIYPIKRNFFGLPKNCISMIGYSDTVPIYNGK